jgi:hypothetical protein
MKFPLRLPAATVMAALTLLPASVHAVSDAEAVAGRDIVKRYADTVVSVELVVTIKAGGAGGSQSREIKREVNGTVISPTGLTVTSLGSIDPRAAGAMSGGRANEGPDAEFKEVKLRLGDNSEIAARVVLKDGDLDLAFIAPESDAAAGGRQFAFVKLDDPAEATVLGTYYEVTRLPKALQRLTVVQLSTIVGIVEKPRRLIYASEQSMGCPLFDAQGHVLGLGLRYYASGGVIAPIIVPAADVADMAKQAMAVKLPAVDAPAADEAKPAADAPAPVEPKTP